MNAKNILSLALSALTILTGIANAQTATKPIPHMLGRGTVSVLPQWTSPRGINYDGKLPPKSVSRCENGFYPAMQRTPTGNKATRWTAEDQRRLEQATAESIAPPEWDGGYYLVDWTTGIPGSIAVGCISPSQITNGTATASATAMAAADARNSDRDSIPQNPCTKTQVLLEGTDGADGAADTCSDLKCPPGQVVDPASKPGEATCIKAPAPTCNAPQVLNSTGDTCIDQPAPAAPVLTCSKGQVIKDGKCVDPPKVAEKRGMPGWGWAMVGIGGAAVIAGTVAAVCLTGHCGNSAPQQPFTLGKVGGLTVVGGAGGVGFGL